MVGSGFLAGAGGAGGLAIASFPGAQASGLEYARTTKRSDKIITRQPAEKALQTRAAGG
jgi:hypothetical protein